MASKILIALFAVVALAIADENVREKKDIVETVVEGVNYAHPYLPYVPAPVVSRVAYASPYVAHAPPVAYVGLRDNGQYFPGKYGPEHQ